MLTINIEMLGEDVVEAMRTVRQRTNTTVYYYIF